MLIKSFVLEGLGNSSYLVGSGGVAAVIDPQRDVDVYLKAALELGVRITYALETHLHADFVSGSRELAHHTGATIGASAAANLQFPHLPLKEGDRIELGELTLEVMETPGHSPEHISFLVREPGKPHPTAVFSGGALTVGSAARTDLLGHEHTHALARQLYHTIHHKLMKLPDEVQVYPTHGGGSFCVAVHQEERTTTIGRERLWNRLVQAPSEEEFVKRAVEGLPSYPTYFRRMRAVNQQGPRVLGGLPQLAPLPPPEVQRRLDEVAVVDLRRPAAFAQGHLPGAYSIPLRDAFASWLGWVVPPDHPIVFVADLAQSLEEAVRQAIRIGYEDLAGYLEGGMAAWEGAGYPLVRAEMVDARELSQRLARGRVGQTLMSVLLVDVRQDSEWAEGHIPGAVHIELGDLEGRVGELPREATIAVTCAAGVRASTGVSLLLRRGFPRLQNLRGGTGAWEKAGLPMEKG